MNIIFIDDNPTVSKVYFEMLKKYNYISNDDTVDFFDNVNTLIHKDKDFFDKYKIVICDLDLGKDQKSGLYFLNILGKNFKGIKILFTSNSTDTLGNIMEINTDKILITKAGANRDIKVVVHELGHIISNNR